MLGYQKIAQYTLVLCCLWSSPSAHAGYIFFNNTWIPYDSSRPVDIKTSNGTYTVQPDGKVSLKRESTRVKDAFSGERLVASENGFFSNMANIGGEKLYVNEFNEPIRKYALENNIDASLIRAIIHQESRYNTHAVSSAGAQGLMQLMPSTAKRMQVSQLFDANENIRGGTRYLRLLLDQFDNNIPLAIAAYNAGEGAVNKYNKTIPPYPETQKYVKRVLGLWGEYMKVAQR